MNKKMASFVAYKVMRKLGWLTFGFGYQAAINFLFKSYEVSAVSQQEFLKGYKNKERQGWMFIASATFWALSAPFIVALF